MTTERSLHNTTSVFSRLRPGLPGNKELPALLPLAAAVDQDYLREARNKQLAPGYPTRHASRGIDSEQVMGVNLVCTCPENTPNAYSIPISGQVGAKSKLCA